MTASGGGTWMPHVIAFSPRAQRDLAALPADRRAQVASTLERFAASGHGDVKKLTDVRPPAHRLRVGDYRVLLVLTVDRIEVERVLNRRDAY